jgi:hypothetical protein
VARTIGGRLPPAFEAKLADPDRRRLKRLSDEELAELIAREPESKLGRLAESVMRSRDSWRTPARGALVVSFCSFAVAALALIRTL